MSNPVECHSLINLAPVPRKMVLLSYFHRVYNTMQYNKSSCFLVLNIARKSRKILTSAMQFNAQTTV